MADLADRLLELSHLAMEVDPSEAKAALAQVAALALLLAVKAAEPAPEVGAPGPAEGETSVWLNPAQVEVVYGLTPGWLAEHARDLEQAGLVAKPSRKLRLYHRAKLGRWIAGRQAASGGA